MSEVIFGATLIGSLVGWTFILHKKLPKWLWFAAMFGCCAWVVGMEIFSKVIYGRTLSNFYWQWSLDHEAWSWVVAFLMLAGWLNLIVHLQWKVISRRFLNKNYQK